MEGKMSEDAGKPVLFPSEEEIWFKATNNHPVSIEYNMPAVAELMLAEVLAGLPQFSNLDFNLNAVQNAANQVKVVILTELAKYERGRSITEVSTPTGCSVRISLAKKPQRHTG